MASRQSPQPRNRENLPARAWSPRRVQHPKIRLARTKQPRKRPLPLAPAKTRRPRKRRRLLAPVKTRRPRKRPLLLAPVKTKQPRKRPTLLAPVKTRPPRNRLPLPTPVKTRRLANRAHLDLRLTRKPLLIRRPQLVRNLLRVRHLKLHMPKSVLISSVSTTGDKLRQTVRRLDRRLEKSDA